MLSTGAEGPNASERQELSERYAAERKKRMAAGRVGGYRLEGLLERFGHDPFAPDHGGREPVTEQTDVVIVGAGFSGILTAVRLVQKGVRNIRILDSASDFGGTWYWNRYPGAQCDIESYCYMPLLEELSYIPTERYVFQPEMFAHCQAIGRKFGLYELARFGTRVESLTWDDDRWTVRSTRGDRFDARTVVLAGGNQNTPALPAIPGLTGFAGAAFHTSRWNYEYTGEHLEHLADKRVGVIGTGATALQAVPRLAPAVRSLHVFQRTPSTVSVRANGPTDPTWAEELTPGWQAARIRNFTATAAGYPIESPEVDDGWTQTWAALARELALAPGAVDPPDGFVALDDRIMNGIRGRIDQVVKDEATAAALKPYYRFQCKRPGFHDEFLQSFNRDNVTLVDTAGHGVEALTRSGAVVAGKEYPLDCIVFATGFDINSSFTEKNSFEVIGRDGHKLSEEWSDGIRTFQGFFTRGFPNCVFLGMTQTGVALNYMHSILEQAGHAAHVVDAFLRRGGTTFEATAAAQAEWQQVIVASQRPLATRLMMECTPGYFNGEGDLTNVYRWNAGRFGYGPIVFFDLLDEWRKSDHFDGLEFA